MIADRTPILSRGRRGMWSYLPVAIAFLAALLISLPLLSPAEAATTSDELREQLAEKQALLKQAYSELDALQDEFDELAAACNSAETRLGELEAEIVDAEKSIAESEAELKDARLQLEERLVGIYKGGSTKSSSYYLGVLFSEDDLGSVLDSLDALTRIAEDDQALFEHYSECVEQEKANKAHLEEKKAEEAAQVRELERAQEQTYTQLAAKSAEYKAKKKQVNALKAEIRAADARAAAAAEAARQRELAAKAKARSSSSSGSGGGSKSYSSGGGTVQPGFAVFPVQGPHSYVDSFGWPRSGGRTHKGCDIMAARWTPTVACANGIITSVDRIDDGLGGITLHLRGSNGAVYYYAHLAGIASGISAGTWVSAGQVIGYVGNTGNAAGGACHLHFEIRPNGSTAVNPYATLRAYDT